MISIVLYGRNDNYGYNLHKRAALSFNCMAELLTDDSDEILFVDYNTPDDFPTFPEAIQDTLTPLARKRLRIFRVRPRIHERFRQRTRLVALEPISRNIAVRRSNPDNRWILSTNTDMIFVPRTNQWSLSEIAKDLPAGFYHAPRLEIPETLWEGLDRKDSHGAIETIRNWGRTLHLDEIVLGAKTIRYDGPGDFQLIQRSDLFKYQGFHEDMLLGWHVDSNIAKRLYLIYGEVGDLGSSVFGYHCDHTRQITPMHSHSRTQNDWRRFIDNVDVPGVPEQSEIWGCANDDIEEVRLSEKSSAVYIGALQSAIGAPLETPPVAEYFSESYGKVDYDPRHVLPFLADIFVCAERSTVIGWSGVRHQTLEMFASVWRALGFTQPIIIDRQSVETKGFATVPSVELVSREDFLARAHAFVIDFGSAGDGPELSAAQSKALGRILLQIVKAERARLSQGGALRRIVSLNAIHTPHESLILSQVAAGLTPFATRMRHGFILPPVEGVQDWISELHVGDAAVQDGAAIRQDGDKIGFHCFGPYKYLFSGRHRIEFKLSGRLPKHAENSEIFAVVELMWGEHQFDCALIGPNEISAGRVVKDFEIDDQLATETIGLLQTRIRTFAPVDLAVTSLTCESLGAETGARSGFMSRGVDWLPLLQVSDSSLREAGTAAIVLRSNMNGYVAGGPHWTLAPGRYELALDLESRSKEDRPFLVVCVISEGRFRAIQPISCAEASAGTVKLEFEVHENEERIGAPVALYLYAAGGGQGKISGINVRRAGEVRQTTPWIAFPDPSVNWVPFLHVADAKAVGQRWTEGGALAIAAGERGIIAYGPYWRLPSGRYEIGVILESASPTNQQGVLVEVFSQGHHRGAALVGARKHGNRLEFEVHDNESSFGPLPIEVRVVSLGAFEGSLQSIKVERVGDASLETPWLPWPVPGLDWMPFLVQGPAGKRDGDALVAVKRGAIRQASASVAYGPYWALGRGSYRAIFKILSDLPAKTVGSVDVAVGNAVVAAAPLNAAGVVQGEVIVPFKVEDERALNVEARVWTNGSTKFRIGSIKVESC